jgi:hypothetical protein
VVLAVAVPLLTPVNLSVSGSPWDGLVGSALQAAVLAAGGIWAFVLYLRRREFQPRVRVGVAARISEHRSPAHLFMRLHMVNECAAKVEINAMVVLFAVTSTANGRPTFTDLGRDFPMDYAYGELQPDGLMADQAGEVTNDYEMEPLECIEADLLFCPDPMPDLLAARTTCEQEFKRRDWHRFWRTRTDVWRWENFAYIDPPALSGENYVALTSHAETGE